VLRPEALLVLSDVTNPTGFSCTTVECLASPGSGSCAAVPGSSCSYTSYLRERDYSVLDQFTRVLYLLWIFCSAPLAAGQATEAGQAALNLRMPFSMTREGMPLTKALLEVGHRALSNQLIFGIEVHLQDNREPTVDFRFDASSTLGDVLHQIVRQVPGYEFEAVSDRMINVYPRASKGNPDSLLNTRVERFDVVEEEPGNILLQPKEFIPELAERLAPKRFASGPGGIVGITVRGLGPVRINLHLEDVTVRQILNEASAATQRVTVPGYRPKGWVYSFQPDPASDLGGVHSWSIHW